LSRSSRGCVIKESSDVCRPIGKRVPGSMSVEMSLIMPVIIGVMLFLLYTLYYLHDVAAFEKAVGVGLLRASLETDDRKARELPEEALQEIRLLGKWEMNPTISVEQDEIHVALKGNMQATEGLFRKMIPGIYSIQFTRSARRIDEVTYLRNHRR